MTSVSDSLRRAIRAELAELAAKGMSQREVAGRIGVTQAAVSKIAAAPHRQALLLAAACIPRARAPEASLEKKAPRTVATSLAKAMWCRCRHQSLLARRQRTLYSNPRRSRW